MDYHRVELLWNQPLGAQKLGCIYQLNEVLLPIICLAKVPQEPIEPNLIKSQVLSPFRASRPTFAAESQAPSLVRPEPRHVSREHKDPRLSSR